jgi:hypothetical protein
MAHRYLEFAVSTAVACVAAGVLATAQTPTQAPTPSTPSARPEDGRAVTGVGCLKQERDIHGRTTTSASEEGRAGDAFVLMNARITSASMTDNAPDTSDVTPGATSAAAADRQRKTEPSGAPGAGGAGTSGTGSTSVQTTERPPDQSASGGATAANPAPARGPDTMYKVVGLPDTQLTPLLGKQVEVRATLDANTMGTAALRQPAATMGREPASAPSASTPPPSPTQAPATQSDRQDITAPGPSALPELKATSIRATGGRCQGT